MKTLVKLLVLEDVEEDFHLLRRSLEKAGLSFETKLVDTKAEYVEALDKYPADVILSDHSLPQFSSTDAYDTMRAKGIQIPFIIVTGNVSEEFAVNSIKRGVDDYVLKSNLERLPAAIENAIQKHREKQAHLAELEKIKSKNQSLLKYKNELEEFVNNVSKNLRNPLASMMNVIVKLQNEDESEDESYKAYYEMMAMSIQKLDDALAGLQTQTVHTKTDLTVEVIDLGNLIEDFFRRMKFMSGGPRLIKEVSVNERSLLYTDRYHLSVILNNLISNAIKYQDYKKTDPFFQIHIDVDDTAANMEFTDNGIGIGEESLKRIFDMFFRATDKQPGSGLGLHLVKESVQKLGGNISVKSQLGVGTTFRIQIPNMAPAALSHPARQKETTV